MGVTSQRASRFVLVAAATALALAACGGPQPIIGTVTAPASTTTAAASPGPSTVGPQSTAPQPTAPQPTAQSTGTQPATQSPGGAAPGVWPSGTPGMPRVVAESLPSPWGLAFLPDGRALVTSRDEGTVRIISPDGAITLVRASGPGGAVPGVAHGGEGGLLGIAVPPGFTAGDDVVLYRTTSKGNEVIRAALSADRLGEPRVILGGIPAARNHDGGRVAFGPDGFLYVSTGDAGNGANSQDPDSLAGKILRITDEGKPAPGNPIASLPVWSLGHRNVEGLGWDECGRLFASEFGQNSFDELNLITPGGNYGWPDVEGAGGTDRGFIDPLVTWPTSEASPSGLAVTADAVYLAALRGQRLWRVPFTGRAGDGAQGPIVGEPRAYYRGEFGRLRTVAVGPDGALWVLTNNTDGRTQPRAGDDKLLRIELSR